MQDDITFSYSVISILRQNLFCLFVAFASSLLAASVIKYLRSSSRHPEARPRQYNRKQLTASVLILAFCAFVSIACLLRIVGLYSFELNQSQLDHIQITYSEGGPSGHNFKDLASSRITDQADVGRIITAISLAKPSHGLPQQPTKSKRYELVFVTKNQQAVATIVMYTGQSSETNLFEVHGHRTIVSCQSDWHQSDDLKTLFDEIIPITAVPSSSPNFR